MENGLKSSKAIFGVQLSELKKHELKLLQKRVSETLRTKYPEGKCYDVPPEERVFTPDQLKKFLNAVDNPVFKMAYLTMACTGLRPKECLTLKLEQVDFKESCFWVWPAKKLRPVRVPKYYPKFYAKKLNFYLEMFQNRIDVSGGYLFPNQYGKRHVGIKDAGKKFRETLDRMA